MARVNVYLPDDLVKRLAPHKGTINVSFLTQVALTNALDLIEAREAAKGKPTSDERWNGA